MNLSVVQNDTIDCYYKILISVLGEIKPKIGSALVWVLSTVSPELRNSARRSRRPPKLITFCEPYLITAAHRADKVSCWLIRRGTQRGYGY